MKTIKKKISLEQFKSRMPSIISSYKDGVEYDFTNHTDGYSVNYGMIPKNVVINGYNISYNTLSNWYHFLESYNSLNDSAIDDSIKAKYNEIKSYIGDYDISIYFPCFTIDKEYQNAWKASRLYVSDVIKWYSWFCENEKYDKENCIESDNCCICEKYKSLGGSYMKDKLKKFLNDYSDNIKLVEYAESYINIPITLQNNISNMGEFTSYEDESDYIKPSSQYFEISDEYFSYKDNKLILSPTHRKMSDFYDITYEKCCLINNQLYVTYDYEYIDYQNKLIKVNYINSKPYVDIMGKRYYGILDSDLKFYFQFVNFNNCGIINSEDKHYIQTSESIFWNGNIYLVDNNFVKLPIGDYKLSDGYFIYNDAIHLINDNFIIDINFEKDDNTFGEKIDNIDIIQNIDFNNRNYFIDYLEDKNVVYIIKPYEVYSLLKSTGYTESKVESFKDNSKIVHDDIGNKINGTYGRLIRITENQWLDLIFSPNSVYDLTKDEDGKYWGNLLTEIEFYYNDYYGNKLISTVINIDDICDLNITCLDRINELNELLKAYKIDENFISQHYSIDKTLMCDITYYIGCEMRLTDNITSSMTKYSLSDYKGVKYVDSCKLLPQTQFYSADSKNNFLINYYEFSWDYITNKINNKDIKVKMSKFEYQINPLEYYKENNFIFKEEHKMRSSSIEKVSSDIYIQRGLSKSLDSHLKLLEVKSIESLTKYGNSQFNILNG